MISLQLHHPLPNKESDPGLCSLGLKTHQMANKHPAAERAWSEPIL